MSLNDRHFSALSAGTAEGIFRESAQAPAQSADPDESESLSTLTPEAAQASPEAGSFSDLLDSVDSLSAIAVGEVVPATVIKITDTEVVVDVGLKCESAIPRGEFLGFDGQITVARGDAIQVFVEYYNESNGRLRASYQKAAFRRVWDEIEQAHQEQKTIQGKIIGRTKGGLTVDIGIPAFLPGSQVDSRPHPNVEPLIGQTVSLKIVKVNRHRNNAVVSRRMVLEGELAAQRAKLAGQLHEGAVLSGRVKNLTDYGAFVDLGGIDGLLHITDFSWGRVAKPSDIVQAGQEIQVKVLKYDAEKGRVSLGLRQLTPDPWSVIEKKYQAGGRAKGSVVGIVDYGVFVELEPGVEGLIHLSQMSWNKRQKHPSKIVNAGDQVEVGILDVNPEQRRISLSLKDTLPDPWSALPARMAPGTVVEGRVRNLTDFGAFVEIEEGIDGLIHVSSMSWAKDIRHPSEVLKKGQKVEVVILGIDPEKRRISLGLKEVGPDAWSDFCSRMNAGDVVHGKIVRIADFGAFVEIEPGVEGLCHTSEMVAGENGHGKPHFKPGEEFRFSIVRINPADKKVALSMKKVDQGDATAPVAEGAKDPATDADARAVSTSHDT